MVDVSECLTGSHYAYYFCQGVLGLVPVMELKREYNGYHLKKLASVYFFLNIFLIF